MSPSEKRCVAFYMNLLYWHPVACAPPRPSYILHYWVPASPFWFSKQTIWRVSEGKANSFMCLIFCCDKHGIARQLQSLRHRGRRNALKVLGSWTKKRRILTLSWPELHHLVRSSGKFIIFYGAACRVPRLINTFTSRCFVLLFSFLAEAPSS